MSVLDSPIGRCEAVKEIVLLDQTQGECACEHGCPPGFECPLGTYFTDVSGLSNETAEALRLIGKCKCLKQERVAVAA